MSGAIGYAVVRGVAPWQLCSCSETLTRTQPSNRELWSEQCSMLLQVAALLRDAAAAEEVVEEHGASTLVSHVSVVRLRCTEEAEDTVEQK